MRIYKPGDSYVAVFPVTAATGAVSDADSTPASTVYRNGAADGAVTPAVTRISTGRYKVAFTIPSDYAAGDGVDIEVAATVGGVAVAGVIERLRLAAFDITDGASLGLTRIDQWANLILSGKVSASPSPTTTTFSGTTPAGGLLPTGTTPFVDSTLPHEVRFTSGALAGQGFRVAAYASGAFTVPAMPSAPAAGDTFEVV